MNLTLKIASSVLLIMCMFAMGYQRRVVERKFAAMLQQSTNNTPFDKKYPIGLTNLWTSITTTYKIWFAFLYTLVYAGLHMALLYVLCKDKQVLTYLWSLFAILISASFAFWLIGSMLHSYTIAYRFVQHIKSFIQSPLPSLIILAFYYTKKGAQN